MISFNFSFVGLLVGASMVLAADHPCDNLAKDVPHFSLKAFLKHPVTEFFVARAQMTENPGLEGLCSVVSFGEGCGGIYYKRELLSKIPDLESLSDKELGKLALQLKWRTTVISHHVRKNTGFLFEMTVKMVDDDDYVFQNEGSIKGFILDKNGQKSPMDIPNELEKLLSQQFALVETDGKYSTYATCDKSLVWGTYSTRAPENTVGVHSLKLEASLLGIEKIDGPNYKKDFKVDSVLPVTLDIPESFAAAAPAA